ncbi:MAG: FAD-dependent thymidylate synthase [Lachnospiraceae bacterium]|nr:FAD-dependent thymidylate synthase [Lachnospiraceae bacterium]
MGQVIIQEDTTKYPLQLVGKEAGICWNSDTSDIEKNMRRGLDCIESNHGRTWEFPQIYMELDGYSARVIREFYTHIGGASSRLQSSTRYIDYESGFDYVTPPTIAHNPESKQVYDQAMKDITRALQTLEALKVPREDCAMVLPLGMTTKVVCRMNLRTLADMSHQRLCSRAYWEFRSLMKDIMNALCEYSNEWKVLIPKVCMPKCEVYGFCTEKKSCGRKPKKEN